MKNLFLFAFFVSLTLSMFCQGGSNGIEQMQAGALEMPEYNILYRGYNNKIIGVASGVVSYTLNGQSPTMVEGRPQFIVNPSSLGQTTLTLMGTTSDGKLIKLASNTYLVKSMPMTTVETTNYSKTSGAQVSLTSTDPINIPYSIVSIQVIDGENTVYQGNIIPRDATQKKDGENMEIIVIIRNDLTGETSSKNGILRIML